MNLQAVTTSAVCVAVGFLLGFVPGAVVRWRTRRMWKQLGRALLRVCSSVAKPAAGAAELPPPAPARPGPYSPVEDLRRAAEDGPPAPLVFYMPDGRQLCCKCGVSVVGHDVPGQPCPVRFPAPSMEPLAGSGDFVCAPCADARQVLRVGGGPTAGPCTFCSTQTAGVIAERGRSSDTPTPVTPARGKG
jgi:hypothetical protein